jgi:transposase
MRCLGDRRRRLSAKTALAKAIRYALTRWDALIRYVGDGRIGIDNNPAERSLRGIAVTRKNFLFLGSEAGGERAAIRRSSMGSTPKPISPMSPTAWPRDIRSIA